MFGRAGPAGGFAPPQGSGAAIVYAPPSATAHVLTGSRAVTTTADTSFAAVTMDTPVQACRVLWVVALVSPTSTTIGATAAVQIVLDPNRNFDVLGGAFDPILIPNAAALYPKGITAAPKVNAECLTTNTRVDIYFGVESS